MPLFVELRKKALRTTRAARTVTHTAPLPAGASEPARRYLNRLSDLLFVLARALNRAAGRPDVLWKRDRSA